MDKSEESGDYNLGQREYYSAYYPRFPDNAAYMAGWEEADRVASLAELVERNGPSPRSWRIGRSGRG